MIEIHDDMLPAIQLLEKIGYRIVRTVYNNDSDSSDGVTVFLSRRHRTGMRLAQVERTGSGKLIMHSCE